MEARYSPSAVRTAKKRMVAPNVALKTTKMVAIGPKSNPPASVRKTAPGTRPIVPRKRSLDGSPPRIQSGRAESAGTPPVLPSPMSPAAKPLVRKRPAASQPNIFMPKKRRA